MAASQDAKRSTSKLRLPSDWLRTGIRPSVRHDAMFRVNTAPRASADPGSRSIQARSASKGMRAPYRFSTSRSSRLDL